MTQQYSADHTYLELLRHVVEHGKPRDDRTGVGVRGVFGYQARYDLRQGFPLLTTKKLHTRSIIYELLWMLRGRTDNQWLEERGVSIWREWATEEQCARFGRKAGDLGPTYGFQWRHFGATYYGSEHEGADYTGKGLDQIARLIRDIRTNPNSRRLILSAWNPADVGAVELPPCHSLFQFYVQNGELSCQLYQRSADAFLGVPFNLTGYSILTHMIAHVTGLRVGEFVHSFGDLHLYNNHLSQANLQLARVPRPSPRLRFAREIAELDHMVFDDFVIEDYDPHPAIPASVAI